MLCFPASIRNCLTRKLRHPLVAFAPAHAQGTVEWLSLLAEQDGTVAAHAAGSGAAPSAYGCAPWAASISSMGSASVCASPSRKGAHRPAFVTWVLGQRSLLVPMALLYHRSSWSARRYGASAQSSAQKAWPRCCRQRSTMWRGQGQAGIERTSADTTNDGGGIFKTCFDKRHG